MYSSGPVWAEPVTLTIVHVNDLDRLDGLGDRGGVAQRAVELELQDVGNEVARVGRVARYVVLGAGVSDFFLYYVMAKSRYRLFLKLNPLIKLCSIIYLEHHCVHY